VIASPVLSRLAAAAFAAAAAFHAMALVFPAISDPAPAWRHALFVGVNAGYAVAFTVRPRWLVVAFLPLAAQQLFSHGAAFIDARSAGRTDWQSALVLAAIPIFAWVALGAWSPAPKA
jgi:hypothetical protein